MADLAALRRADAAGLTGACRAGSCSCACSACASPGESESICCSILSMFSVVTPRIWVSPRSKMRRAVHARDDLDLGGERADVGQATAVDADLVAQDALADELLRARSGTRRRAPSRDPRSRPRRPASWAQDGVLDLVDPGLALLLVRDLQGGGRGRRRRRPRRRRRRRPGSPGRAGSPGSAWRPARRARPGPRTARAMNGLAASRPSATTSSVGAWTPWSVIRSQVASVASASTIMIATSSEPSLFFTTRPATTMSKTARSSVA